MNEYRSVLERAGSNFPPLHLEHESILHRRDRKRRNQRITAGVVGIAVFAAAVWIVRDVASLDRTGTTVTPGGSGATGTETGSTITGPTETGPISDSGDFYGLPPEGAEPIGPQTGKIVASVAQLHVGYAYVYADGRVVSWSEGDARGPEPYGFREQRLTPEGIELLLSELLSTGLFDRDVDLGYAFDPPDGLVASVRNGGRFVHVASGDKALPPVTPEQASALEQVRLLLVDPGSLVTASAWADPTLQPYVPYRYAICLGDNLSLRGLPAAAADLLRGKERIDGNVEKDCYDVTTEEARALHEILADAGYGPGWDNGRPALVDVSPGLSNPTPFIGVAFYPILPHGTFRHQLG